MENDEFQGLNLDLNKILNNLGKSHLNIIFVKHTSTRKTLNEEDITTIDIDGEIPPFFRSGLEKFVQNAKDNYHVISPFFKGLNTDGEILFWPSKDELPFLSEIIEYSHQSKKIETQNEITESLLAKIRFYYLRYCKIITQSLFYI